MIKPKKPTNSYSVKHKVNIKKESIKEEKDTAKKLGGKLRPQSGAKRSMPGDIQLGNKLIDQKATGKSQMILTAEMLSKIEDEALREGREPVLLIKFTNKKLDLKNKMWACMPIS